MNYEDVKTRIKKHEGFIAKVYLDSLGKATIGYGHLLTEDDDFEEGIIYDKDILEELFDKDSKFKNMFAALNEFDYTRAAAEMMNSAWYRQTPSRCEELSNLVRKCQV